MVFLRSQRASPAMPPYASAVPAVPATVLGIRQMVIGALIATPHTERWHEEIRHAASFGVER